MLLTLLLNTIMIATLSIYDFQVKGLDGNTIDMASFKGKKILIVNTASECGYTPQYEGLQQLHEKYKDKLVIIGFPSNNFGKQEPGTDAQIAEFCKKEYGVSFLMASKVDVKKPELMAPIYKWLCKKDQNGVQDTDIKWNFHKFLLDEEGKLIGSFPSKVKPMSEELQSAIVQ